MHRSEILLLVLLSGVVAGVPSGSVAAQTIAIGDTLTIIQRPLLNIPALVVPGDTLTIECLAGPSTTGWAAQLERGTFLASLEICSAAYDAATTWWTLAARLPEASEIPMCDLYDLVVFAAGGIEDRTRNAVRVIPAFKEDYYFIHVTDSHLPTTLYYYEPGAATDSSSMIDLRAVIDDINIINPEFVLVTGDFIHEGELEDFLSRRYYTRAQRLMTEFQVPVFLTSGNHDIGGWDSTPPADGTARRDWWRFFGWPRLDDPPPGAPWYTQDYSFDYGTVHFTGLEAYINYDDYRRPVYGDESFISAQLAWLDDDLAEAAGSTARVLFYHYDFSDQIDLADLGVDLALQGHIHSDQGNISVRPCLLATNNVCDGDRSYRLVRVTDGEIYPTFTLSAGDSGERLRVAYSPANDGTNDSVRAVVTNQQLQRFEHGLLRFRMPAGPGAYEVIGGTLLQQADSAGISICHVGVDIGVNTTVAVTLVKRPSAIGEPELAGGIRLWQSSTNPFARRTELRYTLAVAGHVRLSIHGPDGREVTRLVDGWETAGTYGAEWKGSAATGLPVPGGVYFALLDVDGARLTRKLILAR